MMDIEFNHSGVHLPRLGKADGATVQALEMGAEVEIMALNVLGAGLANVVPRGGQAFGVRGPVITVEMSNATRPQFAAQGTAGGIGAPSQDKSHNLFGGAIQAIPEPALLVLASHKRPLLIHFQVLQALGHARLRHGGGRRAEGVQDGVGTDAQHTRRVADAGAI